MDASEPDLKKKPKESNPSLLEDVILGFEQRHQTNNELALQQLELAQARDRREAQAEAQQVEAAAKEWKLKLWQQYEQWSSLSNPLFQRKAEKLGRELSAEEGIEFD